MKAVLHHEKIPLGRDGRGRMEEDVAVDAFLLTEAKSDLRNFSVVLKDSQI